MHVPLPVRPNVTLDLAAEMARRHFDLSGAIEQLPSERDRNFLVCGAAGRHVLKISAAAEDADVLDFQRELMATAGQHAPQLRIPQWVISQSGRPVEQVAGPDGQTYLARVLQFLPGTPLAEIHPHSNQLLQQLGCWLGQLDRALQSFEHPAMNRPLKWDLRGADSAIEQRLEHIADRRSRRQAEMVLQWLAGNATRLRSLRQSVIHNDANDHNVLVHQSKGDQQLCGLIDFGDALRSYTIAELAIACAYAMLDKPNPLAAAGLIVAGYHREFAIPEGELPLLGDLIRTRLAMSLAIAAEQSQREPHNEYLLVSVRAAGLLLDRLLQQSDHFFLATFRHACGLEPCPKHSAVTRYLRSLPHPAGLTDVPLHAPCVLDFGVSSPLVAELEQIATKPQQCEWIERQCAAAGATVGIGRYNEARLVYQADQFTEQGEPRTVHIGLDLFMPAGSTVCSPLEGVVHSFQDNRLPQDYGPTIILRHQTEEGVDFYTLYGHLSRESLLGLRVGQAVSRGQRIATLGDWTVNGGWVPHLHFQIITDLLDKSGDFPGVAPASARAIWLSLCPDPNLLVRCPAAESADVPDTTGLEELRRQSIGSALSLAYRRPLNIVKGTAQFLIDADGRKYLDCVNNVAHVGHCHPHVVGAGNRQATVLNTNTRYLHPFLARYAQRLIATMPPRLEVCFFVNSGSEANELALRMMRAHTGAKDLVVLDRAYHGNTSALVEISPYKFSGPGGFARPDWVHVVPTPDLYRGPIRQANDAGRSYAQYLELAIGALPPGRPLAGFFVESMPSCAGQVILPPGYLKHAFKLVRAAGGVCVADEVQTGFGRPGTQMWAFATQDVEPDIVTLGKPMGNGHPLGAVLTTRPIARSFANGREYFNTFGGNPVSCAIGMAVLDVLEQESLQDNARQVGQYFLQQLAPLQQRFRIIGQVRGCGLFVGIEMVRDRDSLEPADWEADYVVNRLKDQGILISTDGPWRNVLKIKPPMVFGRANVDQVCDALQDVLQDSALRDAGA